jgi:transcription elongation factor GreA
VTYQIVGDDEADIKDGKIAISSPIARALIGSLPVTWPRFRPGWRP